MKLVHDYILVRMMKRKESGLILPTHAKEETTMIGNVYAFAWSDETDTKQHIRLAKHDIIRFLPYAGFEYESDGQQFRLIHERDVILIHGDDFLPTKYQFTDEAIPNLKG